MNETIDRAEPITAIGFVDTLTKDLNNQNLEIPGFPDIAMRLNRALQDENVPVKEIVSLINSEPALVSRLIQLANSAAFNASNQGVADLKAAVGRLGFKIVWGAAASYSIRQLQQHEWLRPVRPWLAEIWLNSNAVAAICFVVAKKTKILRADEAMVAGLLHRVGELYLLTYSQRRGIDIQNDPACDTVVTKWHATIAREILRRWGLPSHVTDAVDSQDALPDTNPADLSPFATLMSAAKLYNAVRDQQGSQLAAEAAAALETTELWGEPFLQIVADCHDDIEAMRSSMG
jgi:HD-like signal output (HDOD) protein